ncbi:putative baseplate assembly protein [Trichocoleus sp. DQ-A3]|uniref:putative baseplate assembly protein n=1 Tax=Cyanophyceae TaxID=3028117 RepID=UPI0016881B7E|nr:putative baseplate assembly protein [Coleofasciculus sp. FACHB-125]MBD1903820.1 putative baseplate assembly protein [Coleofasciculus sp. FACHB-125]
MSRGRIDPPNLDDRTWRDIVEQAKALIPRYTPEWTDHNPSDLGIALIELFAWIAEGMIYRLNRVPDKNFTEFLNLLGITRDPAIPASTFLTYSLVPGTSPLTIPKGHQVATPQTETEEAVIFETDQDFKVLPINLTTALLIKDNKYESLTAALVDSPLTGKTLLIEQGKSITIALGFDKASTEAISLLHHFSKPVKKNDLTITLQYSAGTKPTDWVAIAPKNDGTDTFQKNGSVFLTIPATWAAQNPKNWAGVATDTTVVDQPLFWIGIKIERSAAPAVELGIEHILFNSVSATNALTVKKEVLGVSNGKLFQFFELKNRPILKRPKAQNSYDHLKIEVRELQENGSFGDWTTWTPQGDFPQGEGKYFRFDPVAGTINFGNYHPSLSPDGHGSIPPAGSEIRAAEYRYVVGGVKGNVPPKNITVIRTPITGITEVKNLGYAKGGADEEAIEETKRRAPEVLRNRYRAITVEDYEYLAREASTEVEKVRCLPPREFTSYDDLTKSLIDPKKAANIGDPWNYGGLDRSPGTLNAIIIPDFTSPRTLSFQELIEREHRPMPSQELIQKVKDYLDERRPLTTKLNVTVPRYLSIKVTANIKLWQRVLDENLIDATQFQDDTEKKIKLFLHPLLGGVEGKGWEIGQDINISSLLELIQPQPDIGFVADLKLSTETPLLYEPKIRPNQDEGNKLSAWVRVADYEIICSGTHKITIDTLG